MDDVSRRVKNINKYNKKRKDQKNMERKILVCITNYNDTENAIRLKEGFSNHHETIIIDSLSDDKWEHDRNLHIDVTLEENGYYTGLYNESIHQMKRRGYEWMLFIASDVLVDDIDYFCKCMIDIPEKIRTWSPSSSGQSNKYCKKSGSSIRQVPYLEGFCFMSHKDILMEVDPKVNKYGYGIDIVTGYETYKNGYDVACDDRLEIHHTPGTGYDMNVAGKQMYEWMGKEGYRDLATAYGRSWNDSNFSLLRWIKQGW
jgi:hypothetical protein